MRSIFILRLAVLLVFLAISLPCVFAQGGTPVFEHVYLPPAAETPARVRMPQSEPLPQGWVYAGGAAVTLIAAVVLVAATRAWRASNIFERKHRFPSGEPAALRFGGNRSGGFMAAIEPAKNEKDA